MKDGLYTIKIKMFLIVFALFLTTAFTGYQLYMAELTVRDALEQTAGLYEKDEQVSHIITNLNRINVEYIRYLSGEIPRDTLAKNIRLSLVKISNLPISSDPEILHVIRDIQTLEKILQSDQEPGKKNTSALLIDAANKIQSFDQILDDQIESIRQNVKENIHSPKSTLYLLTTCLSLIFALIVSAISEIFLPLSKINKILLNIGEGKSYEAELRNMSNVHGEIGRAHKILSELIYTLSKTVNDLQFSNESHLKKISALEASKGGIGITDSKGNLIFGNRALFEIHGIPYEDIKSFIGGPSIALYVEDDRSILLNNIVPILRKQGYWQGENYFTGHDGKQRCGDFTLTLLPDNSMIGTVIDITDRKEVERERESMEALFMQSQKMEAIGRLTGGIAHDFNNMLTIVQGNLELLQKTSIQHAPKAQMFVDTALRAINRSAELTNYLLSYSRKQYLKPKNIILNNFLPESAILLSRALGETIDLVMNISSETLIISADPTQLETAILNLAINAKDAMPNGGEITLSTEIVQYSSNHKFEKFVIPSGEYVRIGIEDEGHGMDDATLAKIFEPFFTTKEMGKGTGLGLSMVYGFVKQSKGYIDVKSSHSGTSVYLYFPVANQIEDTQTPVITNEDYKRSNYGKILIVEDEEDLRDLNKNLLIDLGYNVMCAKNGNEALEILNKFGDIDMLLSDVVMPGISGKDLAIEARKLHPEIRIMLTSGYTNEIDLDSVGIDGIQFLAKPYSQSKLANEIQSMMESNILRSTTV